MMLNRRPPTSFEWVGMIVSLATIVLLLGVHFVKSIQALDALLERQDRMAVEICLLTTTVEQRSACERRLEVRRQ